MSGENDIYDDDDLSAVGVRPPRRQSVVDSEGTTRVPIPTAAHDPRRVQPGQMATGATVVTGPRAGMGGIDICAVTDANGNVVKRVPAGAYVPVGSRECPVDPRTGNVGESGVRVPVADRDVGKGRQAAGGTGVTVFPYDPRNPDNYGTISSVEQVPTHVVEQIIARESNLDYVCTWLQQLAEGVVVHPKTGARISVTRRRPPQRIVRMLQQRRDAVPLVAWCHQTNLTLDAWERAGEPVLRE